MTKKRIITFGEIMMRLSTPGYLRVKQTHDLEVSYAGGEANVAVSLANYGMNASFVTRIPNNDIGEAVLRNLRAYNVDTSNIILGGKRLGIYFVEAGAVSRPSKVIYDRENSAIAEIEPETIDWEKVFDGVDWFHWTGITPAISENAAIVCKEALEVASELGITISTDLNYRNKLWNYGKSANEVMEELVPYCDIILGNEEDFEKVFGIHSKNADITKGVVSAETYQSVAVQAIDKFSTAKKIIVTLRGSISASHNSWAGILWDGKQLYKSPVYQITHIVDRVGGGDSFMGGLIYGLLTYPDDDQKALNFATAASCLKHTIKGDFNQVTVKEVEKLTSGDASGRVTR